MFSGRGFELSDLNPFNYDYSISYLDDNLEAAAGTVFHDIPKAVFVDAPVATARGVASAAVTTYDFFRTVTSSAFWKYYIEDSSRVVDAFSRLSTGGKIAVAVPLVAGAVLSIFAIPAEAAIAGATALGSALVFGAANAGCVHRDYGPLQIMKPEPCTEADRENYDRAMEICRRSGHELLASEYRPEPNRCYVNVWCDGVSVVVPGNLGQARELDEPQAESQDEPQPEDDWCSRHESQINTSHLPILSVNGHCSPYMIPARKDAINTFLLGTVDVLLLPAENMRQCLVSTGMSIDEMRSILAGDNRPNVEVDTETSAEPTITLSYRSGFAIQITVGNVMDQLSCMPVEAARPNNMYTCSADVSAAVYTCQVVR